MLSKEEIKKINANRKPTIGFTDKEMQQASHRAVEERRTDRTKEEILKSRNITPTTKHHSYDYIYKTMLEVMELYSQQKLKNHETNT